MQINLRDAHSGYATPQQVVSALTLMSHPTKTLRSESWADLREIEATDAAASEVKSRPYVIEAFPRILPTSSSESLVLKGVEKILQVTSDTV